MLKALSKLNPEARVVTLAACGLVVLLTACGGGGGGGGDSGTNAPPRPAAGLSDPSLTLQQNQPTAISLAQEMVLTYQLSDEAAAAQQLVEMAPGVLDASTSPYACPGGSGTITFATNGAGFNYTYNACANDGYAYTGSGVISPTVVSSTVTEYDLDFSNVTVTGTNAPNTALTGSSVCTPGTSSVSCITTLGGYVWGNDVSYSAGLANGSHQCDCGNGTWNVLFDDFGATSGAAYVYASNGEASVTRLTANTFRVVLTVNGVTTSYDVTTT